jgi:hypothetical protein
MAGNWNFTISQLTGDWVSLLSSDDLALPKFARSVAETVALTPDAVLFRAAWIDIDTSGATVAERHLLTISVVTTPPKTLLRAAPRPQRFFRRLCPAPRYLAAGRRLPRGSDAG